jgi:fumarate hydratase subunit beta
MRKLTIPITEQDILALNVGDIISVSGNIYCGRDIALPKIVQLHDQGKLHDLGVNLEGSLIFHTAVSPAGIGPTSSNKVEIERSIGPLSIAGVKIHLGKGEISPETIDVLNKNNSIFAVVPPVTALLMSKVLETETIAFPEEGMEAFHRLKVVDLTMIVAAAKGRSIYGVNHE